jgi:hypothetical protein
MIAFMAANRLPAIYSGREFAEAGGLIGYSTDYDDLLRQAAGYVDNSKRRIARRAVGATNCDVRVADQPNRREGARADRTAINPCPR